MTMRKRFALIAGLLAGACLSASVSAAPVVTTGGAVIKVYNKSDIDNFSTSSLTYVLVNQIQVELAGPSKLITANFSAESVCQSGQPGEYCSIRLVARNKTTLVETPLAPASGDQYAFDAVGTDGNDHYEGHAVERSARLPAGTYYIRVEALSAKPRLLSSLPIGISTSKWRSNDGRRDRVAPRTSMAHLPVMH